MSTTETAHTLRRLADALEKVGPGPTGFVKALLDGDAAVGAASFLCYLRDCFTASGKDVWRREELLVLLETMSRDREMFPCGIGSLMWQMDAEGQPESL